MKKNKCFFIHHIYMKTEEQKQHERKLVKIPMSNVLISKFFDGKTSFATIEDVGKMKNLDEVFQGQDHAILFLLTAPEKNYGHFVCMFKNSSNLYYFDSYGEKPLDYLHVMEKKNIPLNNQTFHLLSLVKNSKFKNSFYYNAFQYQAYNNNPATCGRYCAMICILNRMYINDNEPFNLITFNKLMVNWKNKLPIKKRSFDRVTTFFINQHI